MKIFVLCFCLVSLSYGQTCTSRWSTFTEVTEGPFYSQEAYGFSVKKTTKRRCDNGRLYLKTTRSLLHPALINFFVFDRFSGFGSCSGSCYSKDMTVNVYYIGNLNLNSLTYDEKIYTFQYTNKNCNKLHWTTWSEMVSCQTSSHAVYARRRCVDCDGVDYPDRRYCYGNETKQIPCGNRILADIDPFEHSTIPTNCSDQRCHSFSYLVLYMIIGGVMALVVLVVSIFFFCKCKSKSRSSSLPKNKTLNSTKSNIKFVSAQKKHNATKDIGRKDSFSKTNLFHELSNVGIQPKSNKQCELPLSTIAPSTNIKKFPKQSVAHLETPKPRPNFLPRRLPSAPTEQKSSTDVDYLIPNNIYQKLSMLNSTNAFARPFNQAHLVPQHYCNRHVPRPPQCSDLNQQHMYIEVE